MIEKDFTQEKILLDQAKKNNIAKIVVAALIVRNDKVLLLCRQGGDFMEGLVELPSGGVDRGETMTAALRREVLEETSLGIKAIKQYLGHFDYESKSGKKTRQFNFFVDCGEECDVHISQIEHSSYHWIPLHDTYKISNLNISAEVRQIIDQFKTNIWQKLSL